MTTSRLAHGRATSISHQAARDRQRCRHGRRIAAAHGVRIRSSRHYRLRASADSTSSGRRMLQHSLRSVAACEALSLVRAGKLFPGAVKKSGWAEAKSQGVRPVAGRFWWSSNPLAGRHCCSGQGNRSKELPTYHWHHLWLHGPPNDERGVKPCSLRTSFSRRRALISHEGVCPGNDS